MCFQMYADTEGQGRLVLMQFVRSQTPTKNKLELTNRGQSKSLDWSYLGCSGFAHFRHKPHVGKGDFWHVLQPKTKISLCIQAVSSESLLSARRNIAPLSVQIATKEYSDQTARMRKLISIFTRFIGFHTTDGIPFA